MGAILQKDCINRMERYESLKKFSDKEYGRLRNAKFRSISKKLRPIYRILARALNNSLDYFVIDLESRSPGIYTIQKTDPERHIAIQIEGNLRKISSGRDLSLWKEVRLKPVVSHFLSLYNSRDPQEKRIRVLCHGARNGTEVEAFKQLLIDALLASDAKGFRVEVIGTDVSPTAPDFGLFQHDFNKPMKESMGKFDIIYSTSLDQSQTPRDALISWSQSLAEHGRIYLEWTRGHGRSSLSELDPFSCETELLPFAMINMFNGRMYISDFLKFSESDEREGVFVVNVASQ